MSFSVKLAFMLIEAFAGALALAFFVAFLVQLTDKFKKDAIYMAIMCIFSVIEFVCLWDNSNVKICGAVTIMYFLSLTPFLS